MSTETTPVDVEVRWGRDNAGNRRLTDGTFTYFACTWTNRVRWSLIDRPDDGLGIRTHGAADSLLLAIEDAHSIKQLRARCYDKQLQLDSVLLDTLIRAANNGHFIT